MQPHIDARKQTINNVRFTTLNLPPLSIVPRPPAVRGLGTRFFQVLGALVWLLIAIVAIGRCSAATQVPSGCMSVTKYDSSGLWFFCGPPPHFESKSGPGIIETQASPPAVEWQMPSGWIFPQGNGWIVPPPDTLRCRRLGAEFVCTDRRQETTCRLVGLEWVCDRRSRF